jgi:alkanesulfonate monooxygenase SsuD/methylene tetrahydromethanopterin reductase-like flavin-dependent oxidoreductase (luciferase family)
MMFLGTPLIGDADKVAAILADMYKAGLDGAVFMFPDYIDDQIVMGTQIMPRFRELVERS